MLRYALLYSELAVGGLGVPVVRTDGRSFGWSVYGHMITEFSGMGRFTYPWCSAIIITLSGQMI